MGAEGAIQLPASEPILRIDGVVGYVTNHPMLFSCKLNGIFSMEENQP
jgi:hypothetical protein